MTRIRLPSFGALAMWRQESGSGIIFPPALLQVASVASLSKTVNSHFAQPSSITVRSGWTLLIEAYHRSSAAFRSAGPPAHQMQQQQTGRCARARGTRCRLAFDPPNRDSAPWPSSRSIDTLGNIVLKAMRALFLDSPDTAEISMPTRPELVAAMAAQTRSLSSAAGPNGYLA